MTPDEALALLARDDIRLDTRDEAIRVLADALAERGRNLTVLRAQLTRTDEDSLAAIGERDKLRARAEVAEQKLRDLGLWVVDQVGSVAPAKERRG